jgi:hypothetical protein
MWATPGWDVTIFNELDGARGYFVDSLSDAELAQVRAVIGAQYLANITRLQPDLAERAREAGMTHYHTLPITFDHARAWPKAARLLDPSYVDDFSRMGFFGRVREHFGASAYISNGELNWRLVRPQQASDVGPVHADKWFWDAGYGEGLMPVGFDRFKIWIAIFTEPGANGLMIKPGSHHRDWAHHFEERDGARKPVFDEDPDAIGMQLLPLGPGKLVMFHDRLLHGGVVNRGNSCRVSIELTVLYDVAEAQALDVAA